MVDVDYREYNFVFNNCHMFTSACLTGKFRRVDGTIESDSDDNTFTFLKDTVSEELGADNWRVWDRDGTIQQMCDHAIREIGRDRRLLKELITADFDRRRELLDAAFSGLEKKHAIKDIDGFLQDLASIAGAYGGQIPWQDFESFDDWMEDDDTVLKL